jgi:hypothetical protein
MKYSMAGKADLGMAMCILATCTAYGAPGIRGFVDAGYNYNLTIPVDSTMNRGHSYDARSKTFTLNSAHMELMGSDSATGIGYDIQVDAGTDAIVNKSIGLGAGDGFDIQEAYLTYAFGPERAWGLKAGKFATHEGIEVIESGSNPTITRGFLFGLAECYTHTGIEVSYADKIWNAGLGLVNGWDQAVDVNTTPTFLGMFGLNLGDPLTLMVSTLIGPEAAAPTGNSKHLRMSFDATGINKSSKMVDLNFQVNYGQEARALGDSADASWFGVGLQPLIHINDMFGIGARYEYFHDAQGVRSGFNGKLDLQNISIAPTFWVNKYLTARLEYRVDIASEKVYGDAANPKNNQMEAAGELIAAF